MISTSAGACRLKHLGTALRECQSLAELRVSNNALQSLPAELSSNKRLKIVEAGSNNVMDIKEVQVCKTAWLTLLHYRNVAHLFGLSFDDIYDVAFNSN